MHDTRCMCIIRGMAECGDRRGVGVRGSGDARPRARASGARAVRARVGLARRASRPGRLDPAARTQRLEPHAAVHHERGGARRLAPTSRSSASPTKRPRRSTPRRAASIVDLSGAHRFVDAGVYDEWYGFEHPQPDGARVVVVRAPRAAARRAGGSSPIPAATRPRRCSRSRRSRPRSSRRASSSTRSRG